jgi:hypothetical protein
LLWGFGVSLVERAIIGAFCRATGTTCAQAVAANSLGIDLGDIHEELAGTAPGDWLGPPPQHVALRHTVGLGDPITDPDIPPLDLVDDCLPQSLAACIESYGLTHFKIKLCGDPPTDVARLSAIAGLLANTSEFGFTLDGNEQYRSAADFRGMWEELTASPKIQTFLENLLFVEQPLHRDVALSDAVAAELLAWDARPPIIIDESDGALDSAKRALDSGYAGTSHKNCKGIIKGIANAALIAKRRKTVQAAAGTRRPSGLSAATDYVLSGEDLCNVGPVAMLQDLTMAAILNVTHVERNGHHYFAGLSMYPDDIQAEVLAKHPDLYRESAEGWPTLAVDNGRLSMQSILAAPFGVGIDLDPSRFTAVADWTYGSLGLG